MMLVVKRRLLFLWVSTCSVRGGVRDVVAVCAIAMCWRLGKLVGVCRLTLLVCSCAMHFGSMLLAMHQG